MSSLTTDSPPATSRTAAVQVCFGGIRFDNVTLPEAVDRIEALAARGETALVVTPNVDHVIRMREDAEYAAIVGQAALVLADGQPIVWATRLLGRPLKARVAGSDLFPALCARAAETGRRVFFLGGDPGAADRAREILTARHPGLQVVGTACPPHGFDRDPVQLEELNAAVRAAETEILFVGLGSPKQERWLRDHLAASGATVGIGIGVSFSFVAGTVKRAPRWMQRWGLEWLHRLLQEPGRLAYRYLVRGWGFVPILAREWWHRSRSQAEERA